MKREFERIAAIREQLERPNDHVVVGIGDDAAVLTRPDGKVVLTVDVAVEGVHFRRDLCSLRDAGYRAFTAAVSDLAAMGAHPRAALLALVLPPSLADDELFELVGGVGEAADATGTPVVGGNLSGGRELSVTTTVTGEVEQPLLRRGAEDGDTLYVTGEVGSAALGLALLKAVIDDRSEPNVRHCIERWRRPVARLDIGRQLHGHATACIDISDGLLQDLSHLCQASGVGAEVRTDRLPLPSGFDALAARVDADPLGLAFGHGDDYELLFTARPDATVAQIATPIGHITSEPGIRVVDEDGSLVDVPPTGYQHF